MKLLHKAIGLVAVMTISVNLALASEVRTPDLAVSSAAGLDIAIFSELSPLAINRIHSWHIRVSRQGETVEDAQISLTGGMPDHDHGLPTQPAMTGHTAAGDVIIEGIRFHMPGRWQIVLDITVAGATEQLVLDFEL